MLRRSRRRTKEAVEKAASGAETRAAIKTHSSHVRHVLPRECSHCSPQKTEEQTEQLQVL